MPRHAKRSSLKKPGRTITRRALLSLHEEERGDFSDDVRYEIKRSIEAIKASMQELRRHGLSLPNLLVEWDPIKTLDPTPSNTIEAYEGNRADVRVILMLNRQRDNTSELFLKQNGLSHLIGMDVDSTTTPACCTSDHDGGMIARIKTSISQVSWVLHDIFIDMAIVHAKGQPWSGIRERLSSIEVAHHKVTFAQRQSKDHGISLIRINEDALYVPLCSLARTGTQHGDIQWQRCIELWTEFSNYLARSKNIGTAQSPEQIARNIVQQHSHGGQISESKLANDILPLRPGHYSFYFLERRPKKKDKIRHVAQFFERDPEKIRTQLWIIHPKGMYEKAARSLINDGFVSDYPFFIGE